MIVQTNDSTHPHRCLIAMRSNRIVLICCKIHSIQYLPMNAINDGL